MSAANMKFTLKPVVAALALAMAAGSAFAAPTVNQMPGAGQLQAVSLGSAGTSITGNVIGAPITGLVNGATIGVDGKVVLRWGGTGAPVDPSNPVGFNLGSNATLTFSAISGGSAVLNIDASGNSSQIYGNLVSIGECRMALLPRCSSRTPTASSSARARASSPRPASASSARTSTTRRRSTTSSATTAM